MSLFIPYWVFYCIFMWMVIGVGFFIMSMIQSRDQKFDFTDKLSILVVAVVLWPVMAVFSAD